ncbi:peptidoglycan-binding domain-containing protein, partial [Rhizobium tubonense]
MSRTVCLLAFTTTMVCFPLAASAASGAEPISATSINAARLDAIPASYEPAPNNVDPIATGSIGASATSAQVATLVRKSEAEVPSAAVAKLQVLLDRAGASPGVIDGLDGANFRNAVSAFEAMKRLPEDAKIGPQVIAAIDGVNQVIGSYVIEAQDIAVVVGPIPKDYARMAEMKYLGYATVTEGLAERFHMGEDLLKA